MAAAAAIPDATRDPLDDMHVAFGFPKPANGEGHQMRVRNFRTGIIGMGISSHGCLLSLPIAASPRRATTLLEKQVGAGARPALDAQLITIVRGAEAQDLS